MPAMNIKISLTSTPFSFSSKAYSHHTLQIQTLYSFLPCELRWAVSTVLWIGFCHTWPISLCVDLFVFISVYFLCFCYILHRCCIYYCERGGWTWWDWSL